MGVPGEGPHCTACLGSVVIQAMPPLCKWAALCLPAPVTRLPDSHVTFMPYGHRQCQHGEADFGGELTSVHWNASMGYFTRRKPAEPTEQLVAHQGQRAPSYASSIQAQAKCLSFPRNVLQHSRCSHLAMSQDCWPSELCFEIRTFGCTMSDPLRQRSSRQ